MARGRDADHVTGRGGAGAVAAAGEGGPGTPTEGAGPERAGGNTARGEAGGVRSFVAVPLAAPLQAELLATARGLEPALPAVKWTRKVENLHVTIEFLGPIPEARLRTLADALAEELAARSPFALELQGFGAFPDERRAMSIWVGVVDPDGRLAAVATSVRRVTARMGFASERRAFRPHVTVGRCKRGVDARGALEAWRTRRLGIAPVGEVHLYESRLGQEGSTYLLRGRAPLLGPRKDPALLDGLDGLLSH